MGKYHLDADIVKNGAPSKNKTNPRENLEFVLFYTRDYFGLKNKTIKYRVFQHSVKSCFSARCIAFRLRLYHSEKQKLMAKIFTENFEQDK